MRETTKQNLSILAITILLAGTVFIFINFINPLIKEINNTKRKIAETQKKIQLLQECKSKSESLIQSYLNMGEEVQKIHYALPDNAQTAQILALIDNVSQKNGIFVNGLRFNEKKEKNYHILEIKMSFTSSYERTKTFLDNLEKELRLLDLEKIDLKSTPAAKTTKRGRKKTKKVIPDLDVDLTINAYYLGEEEI